MTYSFSRSHFPDDMHSELQKNSSSLARYFACERVRRTEYFPAEMFAEPAWDILLELYVSRMDQTTISVGQLSGNATVPATTTIRWLKILDAAGYVLRRTDPVDARRVFVLLTPKGLDAMYAYLSGGAGEPREPSRATDSLQRQIQGDPFGSALHS